MCVHVAICDRRREKGPFDTEKFYSGFCKYEAMSFAENLRPIDLMVTEM